MHDKNIQVFLHYFAISNKQVLQAVKTKFEIASVTLGPYLLVKIEHKIFQSILEIELEEALISCFHMS